MKKMIFVNLPVANVAKSTAFYEQLGAKRDTRFCNGETSMLMFEDNIAFMLLSHRRFADFTKKEIIDAKKGVQALFCFSAESRAQVDATIEQAVRGGGIADPGPIEEYGFMYGRSYEDLDGNLIGVTWMDVDAALKAMPQAQVQA